MSQLVFKLAEDAIALMMILKNFIDLLIGVAGLIILFKSWHLLHAIIQMCHAVTEFFEKERPGSKDEKRKEELNQGAGEEPTTTEQESQS